MSEQSVAEMIARLAEFERARRGAYDANEAADLARDAREVMERVTAQLSHLVETQGNELVNRCGRMQELLRIAESKAIGVSIPTPEASTKLSLRQRYDTVCCTERQAKLVGGKLDHSGIPENEFLKHFGINAVGDLPFAKVDEALQWIQGANEG